MLYNMMDECISANPFEVMAKLDGMIPVGWKPLITMFVIYLIWEWWYLRFRYKSDEKGGGKNGRKV
jgi:hypothetical protein